MSYEKHTWETGEVITAEKLNNLEGGVDKAQNGWEVTKDYTTVWEGSVTTETTDAGVEVFPYGFDNGDIDSAIFADTVESIRVTLNGDVYVLSLSTKEFVGGRLLVYYGAEPIAEEPYLDFSQYPISFVKGSNVAVSAPGTYTMKLEAFGKVYSVGEDFTHAVQSASSSNAFVVTITKDENDIWSASSTFAEMVKKHDEGNTVIVYIPNLYTDSLASSIFTPFELFNSQFHASGFVFDRMPPDKVIKFYSYSIYLYDSDEASVSIDLLHNMTYT